MPHQMSKLNTNVKGLKISIFMSEVFLSLQTKLEVDIPSLEHLHQCSEWDPA
jgi:hypothetical protein